MLRRYRAVVSSPKHTNVVYMVSCRSPLMLIAASLWSSHIRAVMLSRSAMSLHAPSAASAPNTPFAGRYLQARGVLKGRCYSNCRKE